MSSRNVNVKYDREEETTLLTIVSSSIQVSDDIQKDKAGYQEG